MYINRTIKCLKRLKKNGSVGRWETFYGDGLSNLEGGSLLGLRS